jgi:hypothetical protein
MEYYAATAPLDLIFGSSSNATQTQMPSGRRPSPSTGTTSPSTGRRPPTPLQHEEDDYPPTSVLITTVRTFDGLSPASFEVSGNGASPLSLVLSTPAPRIISLHTVKTQDQVLATPSDAGRLPANVLGRQHNIGSREARLFMLPTILHRSTTKDIKCSNSLPTPLVRSA